MLFSADTWAGVADGTITVTYRRWKRPQAVVGRRYRTPVGFIVVDAVDLVDDTEVPDGVQLHGDPSLPVTRIWFHRDPDDTDPRDALAHDADVDVGAVTRRLDRKLKDLGLTLSLDVGYRLSPRGEL